MDGSGGGKNEVIDERDRHLIRRAQADDRDALEELVRTHFRAAYNFAYKLCGNADDVSDIVSEAFVRMYHALLSFRGDASFTTWLYRLVTSVFLEKRKQDQARQRGSLGY